MKNAAGTVLWCMGARRCELCGPVAAGTDPCQYRARGRGWDRADDHGRRRPTLPVREPAVRRVHVAVGREPSRRAAAARRL